MKKYLAFIYRNGSTRAIEIQAASMVDAETAIKAVHGVIKFIIV